MRRPRPPAGARSRQEALDLLQGGAHERGYEMIGADFRAPGGFPQRYEHWYRQRDGREFIVFIQYRSAAEPSDPIAFAVYIMTPTLDVRDDLAALD